MLEDPAMRRSVTGLLLALGLLVPLAANAQPSATIPRVGFIDATSPDSGRHLLDAFRQGLRELGYIEGHNITIEARWAEERPERFPDLVAELLRLQVDVLVIDTGTGARAAQQATQTLPVVFVAVGDPVAQGIIPSLARPGGNITGLSYALAEGFAGKWVELLKEAIPNASRLAVLRGPGGPVSTIQVKDAQVAAQALGMALQAVEVRERNELESALSTIVSARADALLVMAAPLFVAHRAQLIEFAAKNRIPALFFTREFVEAGGLMAYGASLREQFRRAATYVDKILKGAKPADLPVEQPTKFEFIINLKTAQALGLTIPPTHLVLADEVIQ
jgi:putative ABC transport system substrate-binding protein